MKLQVSFDSASHARRYELLFDGCKLYMTVKEEVVYNIGETEVQRMVLNRFGAMINEMLHKAFSSPVEVDAKSYGYELDPAKFYTQPGPFHKGGIVDAVASWPGDYYVVDKDLVKSYYSKESIVNTTLKTFDSPATPAWTSGTNLVDSLSKVFPALNFRTRCPDVECSHEYNKYETILTALIPHLNDKHEWSRQQIADWLEGLDVDIKAVQGV